MNKFSLQNLLKECMHKSNIYIQAHNNPDADTLCSAQIIKTLLSKYQIQSTIIYYGKIVKPNLVKLLELFNIKADQIEDKVPTDLLITVDCQYGESNVFEIKSNSIIVIDHHIDSTKLYDNIRLKSDDNKYKACTTLIYDSLFKEFAKTMPLEESELSYIYSLVYYGLLTDTNNFTESLGKNDNKIKYYFEQSELLMRDKIDYLVNENISIADLKVIANSFDNIVIMQEIKTIYVEVELCDPNVLGVISDMLLSLADIDLVVSYMKTQGDYKLSIRSDKPEVRANELVNYLTLIVGSGGGHLKKAGGVINIKKLNKLNTDISDYIRHKLKEFVEISMDTDD